VINIQRGNDAGMARRDNEIVQVVSNTLRMHQIPRNMDVTPDQYDTRDVFFFDEIQQRVAFCIVGVHVIGFAILFVLPNLPVQQYFERCLRTAEAFEQPLPLLLAVTS